MMHRQTYMLTGRSARRSLDEHVHVRLVHDLQSCKRFAIEMTKARGLIIALSGSGTLQIGQTEVRLAAGQAVRYGPRMPLAWRSHGAHLVRMTMRGYQADKALTRAGAALAVVMTIGRPALRRLSERLLQLRRGQPGQVFPMLLAWEVLDGLAPQEQTKAAPDFAAVASEVIDEQYPDELTVASLAQRLGVDRSTLFRQFKQAYGMSPKQYLDGRRLDAAEALLLTTSLPIGEVARRCGFSDPDQFSRRFRQRFGRAPSQG